ncbi:MAG: HDIG domain-containing protein [Planctomycetaceae bacterium]|jgi:putative nucleotidyltransferase with HDIG domain|nr:HDIG domain-containing protein [Planctomycetaceae bacterium]
MAVNNSADNLSSSSIPVSAIPTKTRSERIAVRSAASTRLETCIAFLKKDYTGLFLFIMLLAALATCIIIEAWNPPFRYRLDNITERAVVCRTPFSVASPQGKRFAQDRARWDAPHVFSNDAQPLTQVRESLWNTVAALVNAQTHSHLDEKGKASWLDFLKTNNTGSVPSDTETAQMFEVFVSYFKDDTNFGQFLNKLKRVFTPFEIHGILSALPYGPEQGGQEQILVYRKGDPPESAVSRKVSDVLIRDGAVLKEALMRDFGNAVLADQLFNWILPRLKDTLQDDPAATADVENKAAAAVEDAYRSFTSGQMIVNAGVALTKPEIDLLYAEYLVSLKNRRMMDNFLRFLSFAGTFYIILVIAGDFIRRLERRRPRTPKELIALTFGLTAAMAIAEAMQSISYTNAEWEILPLLFFVIIVSITYSWELATVIAFILMLFTAAGRGGSFSFFILLLAVSVSTTIQLERLRSRKKLVIVGAVSGLVGAVLTANIGIIDGRTFDTVLIMDSLANFCWILGAGVAATAVLPFIERSFGILTDMYLLELGDLSRPLLQKLMQVASPTYGHSMQVGMIAENAADAIGARGLLTRIGAYYHDIGKTMRPEYYSENQGGGDNVHDHLAPQVSTLVLISHVKDGVQIAKENHLPRPIIDLIEQHHGTTVVQFFYVKAGSKSQEESTFRYPGPKPRTKEAAILMIADSCESACRSLGTGIAPGKVEAMVRRIIKAKLDDGQFDDSALTLTELKTIELSVIKSIVASMHGRIQYPEPEEKEIKHEGHAEKYNSDVSNR